MVPSKQYFFIRYWKAIGCYPFWSHAYLLVDCYMNSIIVSTKTGSMVLEKVTGMITLFMLKGRPEIPYNLIQYDNRYQQPPPSDTSHNSIPFGSDRLLSSWDYFWIRL